MRFIIYFWYSYNYIFIEHGVKIHRSNYAHKYVYTHSFFVLCIELRVAHMQTKFCRCAACNTRKAERARIAGYWVSTDTGNGHEARHCPREWCNSETTEQIWIKSNAATLKPLKHMSFCDLYISCQIQMRLVLSVRNTFYYFFFFFFMAGQT